MAPLLAGVEEVGGKDFVKVFTSEYTFTLKLLIVAVVTD
jgi:hypothetical protein